ncbi:MAG: hypothetical protein PVI26_08710, partial [Chitinispirillia bacterium]
MFKTKFSILLLPFIFFLFTVCDNADNTNFVDSGNNNRPAEDRNVFGSILVSLVTQQDNSTGYTSVLGKAFNGPTPEGVIWEEIGSSG